MKYVKIVLHAYIDETLQKNLFNDRSDGLEVVSGGDDKEKGKDERRGSIEGRQMPIRVRVWFRIKSDRQPGQYEIY